MEILFPFFVLTGFVSITSAVKWGYPDLENEEDFQNWGGLCDEGKRQSPIGLSSYKAFKGIYKEYIFRNYDRPLINPRVENNGHTVKLKFDLPKMSVLGGGLKGEYILEEVHFHWSSEHIIDERRYPLEMHIVHRNGRYKNVSEAVKHKDGLAVFGVLFHVSDENGENKEVLKIFQNLDPIATSSQIGKPNKITEKIILRNLLPNNPSTDYFFYQGSLTTPSCDESVTWTVYSETLPISLGQIEKLQQIETEDGKKLKNNFRDVQKLRNRAVTYISKWDTRSGSESLQLTSIGLTKAFLIVLINLIPRSCILLQ